MTEEMTGVAPLAAEEDYRVKNAREGKALYVPGRSDDDIAAERAAANEAMPSHRFTVAENARYLSALEEVTIRVSEAECVFSLLARIHQDGDFEGHYGLAAMASLAAKAFASLCEKEIEHMNELAGRLRVSNRGNSFGGNF